MGIEVRAHHLGPIIRRTITGYNRAHTGDVKDFANKVIQAKEITLISGRPDQVCETCPLNPSSKRYANGSLGTCDPYGAEPLRWDRQALDLLHTQLASVGLELKDLRKAKDFRGLSGLSAF